MSFKIKKLGLQGYEPCYQAMRDFNEQRNSNTEDEIWLLEHHPVYTLGLSDKTEHLLNTNEIQVVKTDRGGQVTYHGPGQLIAYLLIDLKRRPYAIKKLVSLIESSIIDYLRDCGINSDRKAGAPGVYVDGEKMAALGVRVRKGCTYHGLAINIDMDLTPFDGINPCGYEGLVCTQMANHVKNISVDAAINQLPGYLLKYLDEKDSHISDVA